MDDDKIVELYLSRDESAVAESAAKYGAALRRIAMSVLNDASAAEECENDAYMQAWRLIPPNEPRAYLFAFLGRIVRHIAIDRVRRASSEKRRAELCGLTDEMLQCIPGGSVERDLEAGELAGAINAYLAGCPKDKRRVFVRRYWYFDSVEEIARDTGFSRSKVKTMLFRMRNELRDYLQKEGYSV